MALLLDIDINRLCNRVYSGAPHNGPPKAADLRTTAVFQERIGTTLEIVHYEPPRSGPSDFPTTVTDDVRAFRNQTFLVSISGQQKPAHKNDSRIKKIGM